jgi:hypothetical protein
MCFLRGASAPIPAIARTEIRHHFDSFFDRYFSFWCILSLVMVVCATSVAIFLPLMSSPHVREFFRQIIKLVKSIIKTKKRQEVEDFHIVCSWILSDVAA